MLEVFEPQPFHRGPASGLVKSSNPAGHIAACVRDVVLKAVPNCFSVTNSAMARRPATGQRAAMYIISPVSIASRTRSGVMAFNASRCGARSTPPSWQGAQLCVYIDSPVCGPPRRPCAETSPVKAKNKAIEAAQKTDNFILREFIIRWP